MTTLDQALRDPLLLGAALGDADTWGNWLAVLRAAYGLKLSEPERAVFRSVAGDRAPPSQRVSELWAICGRRSGKTRMASAIAAHIAGIEKHRLAPGEIGMVLLLSASRAQASLALSYIEAFLKKSPLLAQQIEKITADEIKLKNNVVISVGAASHRTTRGFTLIAVIADETAQWRDEDSATPDIEVYRAVMPALVASGGLWIGISTGYRRIGLLYSKWKAWFGVDNGDVLVVNGPTTLFNPHISADAIARAKATDPEAGDAEWEGGWRADIAGYLDEATIEAAIDYGRPLELPPRAGIRYFGFVDPSGGRHDHFTMAIAHREGDLHIADVVTGASPPFDPLVVVEDFTKLLKQYKITKIIGDNYSAEWAVSAFRERSIAYETSEINRSGIYLECLPLFTRGLVRMPDHPKMLRELRLLERRAHRSGRDSVDHGKGGADDYANSLAGALLRAKKGSYNIAALADGLQNFYGAMAAGSSRLDVGDTQWSENGVNYARIQPTPWTEHPAIAGQWPRKNQ